MTVKNGIWSLKIENTKMRKEVQLNEQTHVPTCLRNHRDDTALENPWLIGRLIIEHMFERATMTFTRIMILKLYDQAYHPAQASNLQINLHRPGPHSMMLRGEIGCR